MKLCKDCLYFGSPSHDYKKGPAQYRFAVCNHKSVGKTNPVTGENTAFCDLERQHEFNKCGPSAKLYEAKEQA